MNQLSASGGKAGYKLDLPPGVFGTLEVHAYQVLHTGEVIRDTRVVYVNPANDLKIDSRGRAWVGTMAYDKRPRNAGFYRVDGDEIVSGHLDGNQKKLRNIRRDPRVALSVEAGTVSGAAGLDSLARLGFEVAHVRAVAGRTMAVIVVSPQTALLLTARGVAAAPVVVLTSVSDPVVETLISTRG